MMKLNSVAGRSRSSGTVSPPPLSDVGSVGGSSEVPVSARSSVVGSGCSSGAVSRVGSTAPSNKMGHGNKNLLSLQQQFLVPGKGGNSKNSSGASGGSKPRFSGGKQLQGSGRVTDSYALMFPMALPVKQVVWAKDTKQMVWRHASIIHARRRADSPEEIAGPQSYDYYVHWQGMDRRMDKWIDWEHLKGLESKLPVGETVIAEVDDHHDDEHAGMDEEYLREHEENTKVKTINKLQMGKYVVDTWYFSPYPKEYQNINTLFVCEYCLSFFKTESELLCHCSRCEIRHPPGNEIYRDDEIAMFELDGTHCRIYCENVCFLSKLFLDHKTLRHPVNLFLFYVMTEMDEQGYHITGYFSKEKYSKNNVSCILTLPQHQRKGYGKFLINFSYSLSRREQKTGTPERPLSDLGKASYMAYWTERLISTISQNGKCISIQEMSDLTCIETADIISCLEEIGVLRCTQSGEYFICLPDSARELLSRQSGKPSRPVNMENLHWEPYDRYLKPYEYTSQV